MVIESECGNDVVNFDDLVRVFAHFRPPKRNEEKNLMNTLDDKLRCKPELHYYTHYILILLKLLFFKIVSP